MVEAPDAHLQAEVTAACCDSTHGVTLAPVDSPPPLAAAFSVDPEVLPLVLPEVDPDVLPLVLPEVEPDMLPLVLPEVEPDVLPLVLPEVDVPESGDAALQQAAWSVPMGSHVAPAHGVSLDMTS